MLHLRLTDKWNLWFWLQKYMELVLWLGGGYSAIEQSCGADIVVANYHLIGMFTQFSISLWQNTWKWKIKHSELWKHMRTRNIDNYKTWKREKSKTAKYMFRWMAPLLVHIFGNNSNHGRRLHCLELRATYRWWWLELCVELTSVKPET